MLMLALRTDKLEAELYLYMNDIKLGEIKWEAHRQLAETIHNKIEELIKRQGLSLAAVEKIGVYSGPGSFTGLRIGISVANALSYGLGIPIVGSTGENWIAVCLENSDSAVTVMPEYGSEPHITKQKK
jgi:tRNA threonylcarbamoyl adenosine modification protein YeaZ